MKIGGRIILVLLVLGLAAPGALAADVRRLEAVGVVPLRAGQRAGALDKAIQAALVEAVTRVARSFLLEADFSEGGGDEVDVEEVLGKRMVPYTSRFRILDDKGERPAMFAGGAKSEYVVVVEVHVDAERVEERLIEAGLLSGRGEGGHGSTITLEVRGLSDYAAYEALRVLLVEAMGARAALPRGFKRGVALLEVETVGEPSDASGLADWLTDQGSRNLRVHTVEVGPTRVVVTVDWTPPPEGKPAPVGAWR